MPTAFAPSCGKLGRTDDDTNTDPLIAPALSLAAGELFELEQITGNELDRLRKCLHHFEFIKVGLAGVAEQPTGRRDWPQRLERCRRRLGIRNLIVAAYADFEVAAAPDVAIVVESAAQLNCAGVLIDTNAKQPGTNLFSHLTIDCLNQFSRRLRSQNRLFAIAGSLTERELAAAVSCGPDLIGMRGGLCHGGDRNRQIDIRKIQSVVTALNQHRNSGPYQTGGNTSLR